MNSFALPICRFWLGLVQVKERTPIRNAGTTEPSTLWGLSRSHFSQFPCDMSPSPPTHTPPGSQALPCPAASLSAWTPEPVFVQEPLQAPFYSPHSLRPHLALHHHLASQPCSFRACSMLFSSGTEKKLPQWTLTTSLPVLLLSVIPALAPRLSGWSAGTHPYTLTHWGACGLGLAGCSEMPLPGSVSFG